MTREQYFSLRRELKVLAHMLKIKKHNHRASWSIQMGGKMRLIEEPKWETDMSLWKAHHEYRHKHILLSLARGKSREQIEKPKDNNLPDERYLQTLMETYEIHEQTVRVSS